MMIVINLLLAETATMVSSLAKAQVVVLARLITQAMTMCSQMKATLLTAMLLTTLMVLRKMIATITVMAILTPQ